MSDPRARHEPTSRPLSPTPTRTFSPRMPARHTGWTPRFFPLARGNRVFRGGGIETRGIDDADARLYHRRRLHVHRGDPPVPSARSVRPRPSGEMRDERGGDIAGEEDHVLRGRRDLHARAEAFDHRAGVGGTAGDVGALRRRTPATKKGRRRSSRAGVSSTSSTSLTSTSSSSNIVVVVRDQVWGDLVMGLELSATRPGSLRQVDHLGPARTQRGGRRHLKLAISPRSLMTSRRMTRASGLGGG